MDIKAIRELLHDRFGAAVGIVDERPMASSIGVDPDKIDVVCEALAATPELAFDCLSNLSGCDYPSRNRIQVVYDLFSYSLRHSVTLRVEADRDAPLVKTVEGVWPAANWLEREVFDLLGVRFEGHGDLRRILLPDDWEGHPLRKDYVEPKEYHGISTVRESILHVPQRR